MKKVLFLFTLIFMSLSWAKEVDPLKNVSLSFYTLTAFESSQQNTELSSTILGTKASFFFSDFRFSTNKEKQNFGLTIKTDNLIPHFPCQIKYGNLSAGGSYSKLNSPLISAPSSPFATTTSSANCITASLPASSSFSKPETLFAQASYSNSKNKVQNLNLNCFYNPSTNDVCLSSLIKAKLPFNFTAALSATVGLFQYEENTFSSWFTTEDFYYHQGNHYCANIIASLNSKKAGTTFTAGFYESPFGGYNSIFKSENFIKINHTSINFCGLYTGSKNLITSSQKNISDCLQLKCGFVFDSRLQIDFPFFVKTGFNFYGNFNLSQTQHDLRFTGGIKITSNLTALTVTALLNASLNSEGQSTFKSSAFQLANIWYFKKVTTTLKTSFTITPATDFSYITFTQKYSCAIQFNKLISADTTLNLTLKDQQLNKMSENSTFQLQIHKNRINYTYKLTFDWQSDS